MGMNINTASKPKTLLIETEMGKDWKLQFCLILIKEIKKLRDWQESFGERKEEEGEEDYSDV